MIIKKNLVVAVLLTFCLTFVLFQILPISSQSAGDYDPWLDINDDGEIDMRDVGAVARAFGAAGQNFTTKAGLTYTSDWLDITDKQGQNFNVFHNLNTTEAIVDVVGKQSLTSPEHKLFYGTTLLIQGFNKTYGVITDETAYSMVQTVDGGYALAGYTYSFDAGSRDFWLVKTNASGNMMWNKTYGGTDYDVAYSVVETVDGGYALAGETESSGAGWWDFWLVKTDVNGNVEWNQTYGANWYEGAYSVVQTFDGGYALVGYTNSSGAGNFDFWLVKTDANGNMMWNKTYGGTNLDVAESVVQTFDGGYALAGYTLSFDAGQSDFWLVKTDASGNMMWNQTYGGTTNDVAYSVVQTFDGGYALVGYTNSSGAGNWDFWLVKTDSLGNHLWNKTYGGTTNEKAYVLVQTVDGGYALAGCTWSFGAGQSDFWLVKTDANGNVADSELGFSMGLSMVALTDTTIIFYRGSSDPYWNYIRVRIWQIKDS